VKKREREKNQRVPILIPTEAKSPQENAWEEGFVFFVDPEPPGQLIWKPVRRFIPNGENLELVRKMQGFGLFTEMEWAARSGRKIDTALARRRLGNLLDGQLKPEFVAWITEHSEGDLRRWPDRWAKQWLPGYMNLYVKLAQPVMWQPAKSTAEPAIYCPDIQTACFAALLFHEFRACPGCGTLFHPSRPNQTYDDLKCANLHRKHRQLSKQKKGGKK
jgi:hypothetical protein